MKIIPYDETYVYGSFPITEMTITIYSKDIYPKIFRKTKNIYDKISMMYNESAGVYILWYKDDVVYVGQSKDVCKRLMRHNNDHTSWKWNYVSFIPCKDEAMRMMKELMLINYYQPRYNKIGKK